ncbi:MAG TPA: DinB family protein [Gemmatimonadaceae bacterium]|nr:DinB family protein [Gemmatimonadaceae bacterium]
MLGLALLTDARFLLRANYLPKLERCLDALDEDDVWWRPNDASNSIGNLMLHLDGSTRAWVLRVAGGRQVVRDRDAEFSERGPIAKAALLARLRATLAEVDEVLSALTEQTLLERRDSPQGEVTVLWGVLHAVEHFAMHTGQIIVLTKLRTGAALRPVNQTV